MTDTESDYDVFISYAREDGPWVQERLYGPLVRCRTTDDRKPRVFMDVSEEGIRPGQNYIEAIVAAMRGSRRILPVYSSAYFRKDMCQWELTKAFQLDPAGARGRLVPVLVEPVAAGLVPTYVDAVHWIDVTLPDWFERLAAVLQLTPHPPASLRFLDEPPDVVVNHTLPPLRVEVEGSGGAPSDESVTIAAEGVTVQGTSTVAATAGVASFGDLSIGAPAASTRLVATAEGCVAAFSHPFAVRAPADVAIVQSDRDVSAPSDGDALLVGEDGSLVVLEPGLLRAFGRDGVERGRLTVGGRTRWVRRGAGQVLVGTWDGGIHLLGLDGTAASWSLGGGGRFSVSGDACIDAEDGAIHAGLWSGDVFRLQPGAPATPTLRHAAGVQALAALAGRLYICGLDGSLCVYEGTRPVVSHSVERTIRLLQPVHGAVVAVGERKLYHASPARSVILNQPLPIGPARLALGDTAHPVVVDSSGRGIRFDADLFVTVSFHTAPGAMPVSADEGGRTCVFVNPDGSRTLMRDGRITFTQLRGTLAVSASGEHAALGRDGRIRLVPIAELAAGA